MNAARSARLAAVLAACALLALPLAAEEPEPAVDLFAGMTFDDQVEEPPAEPERHPRIVAAAWLTIEYGDLRFTEDGEEVEPIGLDGGVGAELVGRSFYQGRLSLFALGGTKSVGAGLSWAWRERGRPVAVGLAVVAPYDSGGLYVDEWAFAAVATVGLFGSGRAGP